MINKKIMLLAMMLLLIPVSYGAIAQTWCKGLSYSTACFNGSTGTTYLTGVKINASDIIGSMVFNYNDFFDQGLNTTNNHTAAYFFGNGTQLDGICLSNGTNCVAGGNSSFNEGYTDTLYYKITNPNGYYNTSTIVDAVGNWSADKSSYDTAANMKNYFFNFTYANYFDQGLNTTSNHTGVYFFGNGTQLSGVCLSNGTNCVAGGNSSFNESYTDTLYYKITNPNGYYNTSTIVDAVGNWSADKSSYYLASNPNGYYNTSTIVDAVGNFSANNASIYANMYNVSNPWHFINASNTTVFIPYTGATNNVTLGVYGIIAGYANITGNATFGNVTITENSTTMIIKSLNSKGICIGNC